MTIQTFGNGGKLKLKLLVPCESGYYYGAWGLSRFLIVGKTGPADHHRPQIEFSHIFYRILWAAVGPMNAEPHVHFKPYG